jgi:uncharacterized repeat protein (TIGR03803 family)
MKTVRLQFALAVVFALLNTLPAPAQTLTTLCSLHLGYQVGYSLPFPALVQGNDGNFYGTTYQAQTSPSGTVFKVTPSGTFTILHNFASDTDGTFPRAALLQARDGNFYGTTDAGGKYNSGTIFKITPSGTLTTLHSFEGHGDAGGHFPHVTELVQGRDGDLYGTIRCVKGVHDYGTIFRITTAGAFTSLHSFTNDTDGFWPSPLVQGKDGNLYGVTSSDKLGAGTVFRVTPTGKLTTLYCFAGTFDGGHPSNPLVQGADGNFYGTTEMGGGPYNSGTIFKITPTGNLTVLRSLGMDTQSSQFSALVLGRDGNCYGTSSQPQRDYLATIFRITPTGAFTNLHYFTSPHSTLNGPNTSTGVAMPSALVQGRDGNFYAMAFGGCSSSGPIPTHIPSVCATIFRFSPAPK